MTPRRKCRLADSSQKDTDLRQFAQLIIEAINTTVPGKNPKVFSDYFSTDPLTQSEAVSLGRALAKIPELKDLGKTVTTFRLFDGRTYESEASKEPINTKKSRPKGGRMN
ncbi:MAG: hypothetical protein J6B54_01850 [Clostridia bacterium]|nr:hypothetical protein [Clostridia bacterium]